MKAPSIAFFFVVVFTAVALHAEPMKVASVGDSITFGAKIKDPSHDSYPAVLGVLLGKDYDVCNFGKSGATMLKAGDKPYWNQRTFAAAQKFEPGIVVLQLGTNDSKPQNWDRHEAEFRPDYEAMIAQFAELPSKPKIFLCLPAPAHPASGGIREDTIAKERKIITEIAAAKHLPVIDLDTPMSGHPEWFADGIHPNEVGASEMAKVVAKAIVGQK